MIKWSDKLRKQNVFRCVTVKSSLSTLKKEIAKPVEYIS